MKKCFKCLQDKDKSAFGKNKRKPDGLQAWCKACKAVWDAEYRKKNMSYFIERANKQKQKHNKWYRDYKSKLSCIKCGENHPATLDFHHRDKEEKTIAIPNAVNRLWNIDKILKEIEKCDVLCSNCHRKEHYNLKNGNVPKVGLGADS